LGFVKTNTRQALNGEEKKNPFAVDCELTTSYAQIVNYCQFVNDLCIDFPCQLVKVLLRCAITAATFDPSCRRGIARRESIVEILLTPTNGLVPCKQTSLLER
jgi:hypothetical protein